MRKRLQVELRSVTWFGSVLLLFLVFGAAAVRSIGLFDLDSAAFDTDQVKHQNDADAVFQTYSQLSVAVDRQPAPLRLLIRGGEDAFASCAVTGGRFRPTSFRSRQTAPPSAQGAFSFDPARVIALLGSLTALLVTSGTIAREREEGTLQVVLTYPCRRSVVLLGEHLAALLATILPVIASVAGLIAFAAATGRIHLDGETLGALAGVLAMLVLLLSAAVAAGLFISASTRNAATAITASFVVWVVFAVLSPAAASSLVTLVQPVDVAPSNPASSATLMQYSLGSYELKHRDQERAGREGLQRIRQADLYGAMTTSSPYMLFVSGAEAASGTGIDAYKAFLSRVHDTESQFVRWEDGMLAQYPERATTYNAGDFPIDLGGIPQNQVFVAGGILGGGVAQRLLMMLIWNAALLFAAYQRFARYDARV
ncbi:MAG TPA: ABC transporter permease subunit [Thermoanaerobaculia bacterium]|nr:ABC transporter permease subunit [Thermoanaerobaculia bacterium]